MIWFFILSWHYWLCRIYHPIFKEKPDKK